MANTAIAQIGSAKGTKSANNGKLKVKSAPKQAVQKTVKVHLELPEEQYSMINFSQRLKGSTVEDFIFDAVGKEYEVLTGRLRSAVCRTYGKRPGSGKGANKEEKYTTQNPQSISTEEHLVADGRHSAVVTDQQVESLNEPAVEEEESLSLDD